MTHQCYICNSNFTLKHNLKRHLHENRCKSEILTDLEMLNNKFKELYDRINTLTITNSDNVNVNSNHNNTININIQINPANKLTLDYIPPDKLKDFIESYKGENLNLLLSDYIKDIICNKNHPENHSIKYIKKKPPTYNSLIEKDGETINVIKGLKDTCELLTDPILDKLKIKLREFLKKYKKDEDFDYDLFEDTIQQLRKELNKDNVKKALSSVLQNDILNTIEMKFNLKINDASIV